MIGSCALEWNTQQGASGRSFVYNLRLPGQYYDVETGLSYNTWRDYDPGTGRYVESDPIGLKGGIDTYAYAKDGPGLLVDPFGLFSLTIQDSWSAVGSLPAAGQIGGTGASTGASCQCTCGNSSSKLVGCVGHVYITVGILTGLPPSADAFARHSESQHVLDLVDASGRYREVGEFTEQDQRSRTFSSKEECEKRSAQRIREALAAAVSQVFQESGRRWDASGQHQYYPWYNPIGWVR